MDHRHLVADIDTATVGQLGAATILWTTPDAEPVWEDYADALLGQWPSAVLVATAPTRSSCRIRTRDLTATFTLADRDRDVDPMLLASLAHLRLRTRETLPPRDRLRLGDRLIEVAVAGSAYPDRH
jgi:hypothetical protein